METLLAPLHDHLERAHLLASDWPKLVAGLKAFAAKESLTDHEAVRRFYGEVMSDSLVEKIVASERRQVKIAEVAEKLKLDRVIAEMMKGNMFFMEVSRWIKKVKGTVWKGKPIPTAAMCYDVLTDDFTMLWNPHFFASFIVDFGEEEGTKIIEGIIYHELYHFTLKHLTIRRRSPALPWNIATDGAINSIILKSGHTLPECGVFPGKPWKKPEPRVTLRGGVTQRPLTPEEKEMQESLHALIKSWEPMGSSDFYFSELMKWARENGHSYSENGIKPKGSKDIVDDVLDELDMHDFWDEIPEDKREMVQDQMKSVLRRAQKKADNEASGWGSIPAELQAAIRKYVDNRVPWDRILRHFVGTFMRGARRNTFKRINRRTPYDFPGVKRDHLPRIAVLVDESGSVDDEQIAMLFAALGSLAKKTGFDVIPFDTEVDEAGIFEWKRGMSPPLRRTRCGGTSFTAACDWINDPKRAGKYDGYLLLTDGECSNPGPSRLRRGWVITPGHKLDFETKDMVINMDDVKMPQEDPVR